MLINSVVNYSVNVNRSGKRYARCRVPFILFMYIFFVSHFFVTKKKEKPFCFSPFIHSNNDEVRKIMSVYYPNFYTRSCISHDIANLFFEASLSMTYKEKKSRDTVKKWPKCYKQVDISIIRLLSIL